MRAPTRTYWGWNAEEAKRIRVPTLVMLGEFDELNASNKELYEDLGAESKVFVSIPCGSHFGFTLRFPFSPAAGRRKESEVQTGSTSENGLNGA